MSEFKTMEDLADRIKKERPDILEHMINTDNSSLVEEIEYDCPICDKAHTIEIRKRITEALIKNEIIKYEQIYYQCNIKNEEFVPTKIMDDNLLKVRNNYKTKY